MRDKVFAAATALGLSVSSSSAEEGRTVWIDVDQGNDTIALQVFAALDAGETGQFRLVSKKSGTSGSAISQQSGRIGIGTGDVTGPFSTSRFSLRAGEQLEAELIVTTSYGRTLVDKISAVAE